MLLHTFLTNNLEDDIYLNEVKNDDKQRKFTIYKSNLNRFI